MFIILILNSAVMWHELFHYHELQWLTYQPLSPSEYVFPHCVAGRWDVKIKGLHVDPSSGMESLSVKSFPVDVPGPGESSTTPTHTPAGAHSQLTAMLNTLSFWNQDHSLTVNKLNTYGAIALTGKSCSGPCLANSFRHKIRFSQRKRGCCGL